jgi:hypothetical protein
VLLKRRLAVLLTTTAMLLVLMLTAMAGAALAVPPQQNAHNCYGYFLSRALHGEDILPPTPVSGRPGNEISALQQGAREQFANCGANQGGSHF